jgi:1-phosphofructokinase/tagatose 6-phosphate kinase
VPIFQLGHRHRSSEVLTLAGGKGINVARALKRLEVPVVATGLAGGRTGTRIVEELTEEAILNDFVRIRDESRTSTAVVDPTSGLYTEINEWGPKVTPAELEMLLEKLRYLVRGASFVVFAGSLPRGVDEGFYADAVRELTKLGARVVLDADGEPLQRGIEAEPWLVSPNQHESSSLSGRLEDERTSDGARHDQRDGGPQRPDHDGERVLRAGAGGARCGATGAGTAARAGVGARSG